MTKTLPASIIVCLKTFEDLVQKSFEEFFEDLLQNNIKMYSHLTQLRNINYFHSLLQGTTLQAYCNSKDAEKDKFEEVITAIEKAIIAKMPDHERKKIYRAYLEDKL